MKTIKNILFEVLPIANTFLAIHLAIRFSHLSVNWWMPGQKKLSLFWGKPVIEPFSYIFVRSEMLVRKCVSHRCKWTVIGRSQVWWVSRVRKYFPTELFNRFLDRFCCMWWCIIMKQNCFVLPFFDILVVFHVKLDSNRSFVVGSTQVLTAHNRSHPSDPTKHRTLSSLHSDLIL